MTCNDIGGKAIHPPELANKKRSGTESRMIPTTILYNFQT